MRYPDGGGLSAQGRARREAVRRQAAGWFAEGMAVAEVARRLRVSLTLGGPTMFSSRAGRSMARSPCHDKAWAIEECCQTAKGQVGLDEYQVRRYDAWYRHITLAMCGHAFLAVTTAAAAKKGHPIRPARPHPLTLAEV